MRTRILIGATVGLVAAGLSWPAAAAGVQADVAAGAKVYAETCGRCHNPRAPTERTDREWALIVAHMRVRAGLTGEQARLVLAFLQATNAQPSVAEGPAPAASRVPVGADGKAIVEGTGCLGCHVVGRSGGTLGPSLNGVLGRRGEDYVRRKLGDPAFDNPGTLMPNPGLSDQEIEAVVEYLKTVQG